jgi:hypothetical protein
MFVCGIGVGAGGVGFGRSDFLLQLTGKLTDGSFAIALGLPNPA